MLSLSVCLLTALGFAYAQAVDPSNPIAVLLAMVTDFQSHAYLMAVAVGVAFVVSLAKQGWLSFWLQNKLPSWALPILAFVLAVGATWSTEMQGGIAWTKALWDAINAAALAVFMHQTIVEHMRGGKELIPARKPTSPAPPANVGSGPKSAPPKAPTSARLVLVSGFLLLTGCSSPVWKQVVNTVLTDVENGTAITQLESAVAAFYPTLASDAAAIASIVQAAINFLVSTGDIPQPAAQPYLDNLKTQIDAAKKTGWAPSAEVQRIVEGFARGDRRSVAVLEAVRGGVR